MTPRLLLVDDDSRLASMVGDYLGRAGFEVETAGSLAGGRDLLAANSYDALVLDLMLPDGDGLDLCREVRSQSKTRQLPLLMLTARGEPMDRIVGLELGADDYLPKPFEPRELLARRQGVLRRASPQAAGDDVLRFGRLEVDLGARVARLDGKTCDLTGHQFDLLVVSPRAPAGSSRATRSWTRSRAIRSKPSIARSTSTSRASAPSSRTIRRRRAASSPCAAPATCSRASKTPTTPRHERRRRPLRGGARPAMKSLYLRIYATVVVVLLLFALVSGWIVERHLDEERSRNEQVVGDRLGAWAELLGNSLPGAETATDVQLAALRDWSQRLRVPLALDDAKGQRIGASESFDRRMLDGVRPFSFKLDDGRTLLTMRPGLRQGGGGAARAAKRGPGGEARGRRRGARGRGSRAGQRRARRRRPATQWPLVIPGLPRGAGLAIVLVVLFLAIAAGAYPVVRRLTRRLEALKRGVEQFGAGALDHRVAISGADEVAAVAASFNVAAARVEALVQSHRSLLANASHELRSPLARMKMAVSMLAEATPAERATLKREIDKNVAELDGLVEEVLLASRLDVAENPLHHDKVDLLARRRRGGGARRRARREHAKRLRRRRRAAAAPRRSQPARERAALRGRRGRDRPRPRQRAAARDFVSLEVCDRGPGVPEAMRERIFEPFFPLARPRRAVRRRRPRPGARQADRRSPRRQRALRSARRRRKSIRDRGPRRLTRDPNAAPAGPAPPSRREGLGRERSWKLPRARGRGWEGAILEAPSRERSSRAGSLRSRQARSATSASAATTRPSVDIDQKPRALCIHAGLMPAGSKAAR